MESNEEELLENVTITSDESGSQYMIQRMSVDNTQLLGTDLLQHHNGLVVDLGGDFIPVNYTSEDLLSQDLTEEDRNLAAALVAVQFSQQQKQQQAQQEGSVIINTSLPSIVTNSKVTLNGQQVLLQSGNKNFLQIVGAENLYKQSDFTQYADGTLRIIKGEDPDSNTINSDGDNMVQRNVKKTLPHKKRLTKKLNKKGVISVRKISKCPLCEQTFTNDEFSKHQALCQTTITPIPNSFACQLCNNSFQDQLEFFEHLKRHYEPAELIEQPINDHEEELDHDHEVHEECEPEQEEPDDILIKPVSDDCANLYVFQDDEMISYDSSQEKPNFQDTRQEPEPEHTKDTFLASILQLTCLDCNKTFRRQKAYDNHVREFHSKNELDEFSEPEDLMAGIDVHPSDDIEEDNKEWYRDDELHATEEDLKEIEAKEHVCHNCQQPFPIRAILLQHLMTCKSTEESTSPVVKPDNKKKKKQKTEMMCHLCDRKFSHRNSLLYHIRSHTGDRPHQCDQCGKSFFSASALKVHLRLHSGDKPYGCEFCGRNFRQWGDLKYHIISIHSDQKQYQCEYCGKDFARKYSLILHRRIHTGERNYRCEFCGKSFRASSYLQNHRRIHTGEKPHPCEICGKRFRVRSDMKRHLQTHSKRKVGRGMTVPIVTQMKIEDTEADDGLRHESEDTSEDMLKVADTDSAVQSLQYDEQETLGTVRDGNTLYVMPILIN